jgi:uncharacterized protein
MTTATAKAQRYAIFDTDVHHMYPSFDALAPYLPGIDPARLYVPKGDGGNPRGGLMKSAMPPGGGVAGSDARFFAEDHLDRHGIALAILNPGSPLGLGGVPDLDLAAAVARATNDWTIAEWLAVDDRFLGSILVAPRDPEAAAQEIRRLGANPRMVQVTLTSAPCLLGSRFLHPIYEAADEFGLPINHHVGGADAGVNPGSYNVGRATTFFEHHVSMALPGISHLVSMIAEGVFVKYPRTRLVMNEFGVAWLPFVMWRMDMEWRAGRDDVPWLSKRPSEYIREFVRFSTQPLEEPDRPVDLVTLIDLVGGDELLMFSSDYPHWDFDNPRTALRAFPDDWKRKVFFDNAREFFALDQRVPSIVERAVAA